jgi:hypothetical protein
MIVLRETIVEFLRNGRAGDASLGGICAAVFAIICNVMWTRAGVPKGPRESCTGKTADHAYTNKCLLFNCLFLYFGVAG